MSDDRYNRKSYDRYNRTRFSSPEFGQGNRCDRCEPGRRATRVIDCAGCAGCRDFNGHPGTPDNPIMPLQGRVIFYFLSRDRDATPSHPSHPSNPEKIRPDKMTNAAASANAEIDRR